MRESIFSASIRSFFVVLCGVAGFCLGLLFIVLLLSALSISTEGTPKLSYSYTPEIKPNAAGIRKEESSDAPVILKLNVNGIIGIDKLNRHTVAQQLIESRERVFKNGRVKAILLCIDSPGGSVVDADGIYREIIAYKEKYNVPIYAFVDGLCASGGYYVAIAADKIFASDASLIGSVGVLLPSAMNFSQLMEKIGIQSLTLYDGKGKDNLNPFRPWRKGEEDNLQHAINYYYKIFVNLITTRRPNLDATKLVDDYGANVFPAQQAKEYGYIDENGYDLSQTLKLLAEKIGIQDDYYQVIELETKNWVSELFTNQFGLLKGEVTHHIELDVPFALSNQFLYLYRP